MLGTRSGSQCRQQADDLCTRLGLPVLATRVHLRDRKADRCIVAAKSAVVHVKALVLFDGNSPLEDLVNDPSPMAVLFTYSNDF